MIKERLLTLVCSLMILGACADELPSVTSPPQSQTVAPGSNVFMNVVANGASDYQWRHNGTDISGATNSTLIVTSAQFSDAGYYLVLVKNSVGWVPSRMAYLSVVDMPGKVRFTNRFQRQANYPYPYDQYPITNGMAQLIAGPALDQMQPIGDPVPVPGIFGNGYFDGGSQLVPTVRPGQTVYCRVEISYRAWWIGYPTNHQLSTVITLPTGGASYPTPLLTNIYFPGWIEWPSDPSYDLTPTDEVRIPGESITLTEQFIGYTDLGIPSFQWRKDGNEIGSPTNFNVYLYYNMPVTLTITNLQPTDAGIYDVKVLANNWSIAPSTLLSVQLANGPGFFVAPRFNGTNFICNLVGAAGRSYKIQSSADLVTWTNVITVTNTTGTVTFSNSLSGASAAFYRARLLP